MPWIHKKEERKRKRAEREKERKKSCSDRGSQVMRDAVKFETRERVLGPRQLTRSGRVLNIPAADRGRIQSVGSQVCQRLPHSVRVKPALNSAPPPSRQRARENQCALSHLHAPSSKPARRLIRLRPLQTLLNHLNQLDSFAHSPLIDSAIIVFVCFIISFATLSSSSRRPRVMGSRSRVESVMQPSCTRERERER